MLRVCQYANFIIYYSYYFYKFRIVDIDSKEKQKKGVMPFKTSTLQQVAANKLNFASSKTMRVAQKLYEGIDIGSETVGLITYMRTDSERLSPQFINEAFKYIKEIYGDKYVGYVKQQKKNDNMQDAHEGIRVTSAYRTPESLKKYLTPSHRMVLGTLMSLGIKRESIGDIYIDDNENINANKKIKHLKFLFTNFIKRDKIINETKGEWFMQFNDIIIKDEKKRNSFARVP